MTHAKLPAAARELVSVCVEEARDMGEASADLAGQSVRHRTAQARERLAWHREVSGPPIVRRRPEAVTRLTPELAGPRSGLRLE